MTNPYIEHINEVKSDIYQFIQKIVSIETPSDNKQNLDILANYLCKEAISIGGDVRTDLITSSKYGNHLRIHWQGIDNHKPILILCHYDTIWPIGTLTDFPYSISGDVARGPGIFDMKTGLAQGLWAIRTIIEKEQLNSSVIFICTSDEEIGSPSSRDLILSEAINSKAVLVLEPSFEGSCKTGRKGVAEFIIEISGISTHAGINPEDGVSAIEEIARQVIYIQSLSNYELGTTLNVGLINGGTFQNVVPDKASIKIDVRASQDSEMSRIYNLLENIEPYNPKSKIKVVGRILRPVLEKNVNTDRVYKVAKKIAADLGIVLDEVFAGGASDGNLCSTLDIPILDGMGAVGGGAHSLSEHVYLSEIPRRTALLATIIQML